MAGLSAPGQIPSSSASSDVHAPLREPSCKHGGSLLQAACAVRCRIPLAQQRGLRHWWRRSIGLVALLAGTLTPCKGEQLTPLSHSLECKHRVFTAAARARANTPTACVLTWLLWRIFEHTLADLYDPARACANKALWWAAHGHLSQPIFWLLLNRISYYAMPGFIETSLAKSM